MNNLGLTRSSYIRGFDPLHPFQAPSRLFLRPGLFQRNIRHGDVLIVHHDARDEQDGQHISGYRD
jgi:hypothetical protein